MPILTVLPAVLPSKAATVAVLLLAVLTVWLAVRLAVLTVLLAVATSASLAYFDGVRVVYVRVMHALTGELPEWREDGARADYVLSPQVSFPSSTPPLFLLCCVTRAHEGCSGRGVGSHTHDTLDTMTSGVFWSTCFDLVSTR